MTDPLDFVEYRGRELEEHLVSPLIRFMQFGRFVLPIPKIWPPSPWRWPSEDLSIRQIEDWRVDHAVEILNQESEWP